MAGEGNGSWDENRKMFLDWKERDEASHQHIMDTLTDIRLDVAQLKTGARIAGAISGFLAATIVTLGTAAVALLR